MANEQELYEISAQPKQIKKIEVIGNNKSDLDCEVFDDKAHIIINIDDQSDYCYLEFQAKEAHYTLRIKNNGIETEEFSLNSN